MAAPAPYRSLIFLIDALHASAASSLRHALARFANLLALGGGGWQHRPADVGLALVSRTGAGVQLQVVYKPSRFALRDFQAAVTRLREHDAWSQPDTRKLVLALRSLVQHLAAAAREAPDEVDGGPAAPSRVVLVAHSFSPPAGGLLTRVLEEAARGLISVAFLSLNTEQSLEVPTLTAGAVSSTGGTAGIGAAGADGGAVSVAELEAAATASVGALRRALARHENAECASAVAGPRPSYCRVESGALLPPEAAPPDPLTARLGEEQELRLSGRSGPPQALVDDTADWRCSFGGPAADGQAPPPVQLVAERVVTAAEVDEAITG
ncbi:hypothetical protein GPECTOR_7g910 [Gonium pectorale]|uniref:Uncharacterized protein n=1 Tax=Gonium pectorale TaxID=33097 RepID=A0A150GVT2_GONPE|nr:hypothetical protein GPECTOR_7g910 [Gonium pectorale]|eukprot:KXZ53460.1 hypothetical protein GPECTOR_7g910 [Gonium pectorale]